VVPDCCWLSPEKFLRTLLRNFWFMQFLVLVVDFEINIYSGKLCICALLAHFCAAAPDFRRFFLLSFLVCQQACAANPHLKIGGKKAVRKPQNYGSLPPVYDRTPAVYDKNKKPLWVRVWGEKYLFWALQQVGENVYVIVPLRR
jgi:hypothetical protein